MPLESTDGERRPKDPVQSAKLSSECGIHIRNKFPLATHWKQYSDKDSPLINVIPDAIKTVAVSLHTSSLHIAECIKYFSMLKSNYLSFLCRENLN